MKLSKEFSRKNSKLTNDIEKGGVLQLTCSEMGSLSRMPAMAP